MRLFCILLWILVFQVWGSAQDSQSMSLTKFEEIPNSSYQTLKNLQLSHIEIKEQFIDFKRLQDTVYRHSIPFGEALSQSFDSIAPYANYPVSMNLPHYLNDLTFHFMAIDWAAPHKIKYSYYLEGFEKDWSIPNTKLMATYLNLPHGKYTLKVKAMGVNQRWSQPFEYNFSIHRPWWHSPWVYFFYFLMLAAASIGIYYNWQKRKEEALEIQRLLAENELLILTNSTRRRPIAKQNQFLNLVNQTLEKHLSDENFGIAELCKVLTFSRTKLHRKLKKLTGQSTSHYIRSLRLDIAKGLLEKTQLNVSEVAFRVGFSSATYFSQVFKEEFGYAPRDIR